MQATAAPLCSASQFSASPVFDRARDLPALKCKADGTGERLRGVPLAEDAAAVMISAPLLCTHATGTAPASQGSPLRFAAIRYFLSRLRTPRPARRPARLSLSSSAYCAQEAIKHALNAVEMTLIDIFAMLPPWMVHVACRALQSFGSSGPRAIE
jgi:hypothetical protein